MKFNPPVHLEWWDEPKAGELPSGHASVDEKDGPATEAELKRRPELFLRCDDGQYRLCYHRRFAGFLAEHYRRQER